MPLLQAYMEKIGVSTKTLELKPKSGQGLIVKNIEVVSSAASDYLTIMCGKTTVGYIRIANKDFNNLPLHRFGVLNKTILNFLSKAGLNTDYPVMEEETFSLQSTENMDVVKVTYEVHDAADITAALPNGSLSKEYFFLNYGTNQNELTESKYYTLDKTLCPVEFPDFPFGAVVPSKTEISILGLLVNEYEKNNYADTTDHYHHTMRLRLIRGRETLYDDDKRGFYILGDGASAGSVNEKYGAGISQLPWLCESKVGEPLLLPTPLIFSAGAELNVQVEVGEESTISIPAEKIAVAIIEKVTAIA